MKERIRKRDAGSIFNPMMYLVVLLLTAELLLLFVAYRRVSLVSETVTDGMTDALLGTATLQEEELYHYGETDRLEVFYPAEKYAVFRELLCEELGLTADLFVTERSIPLLRGQVEITDFEIYSVGGEDITYYRFDQTGGHTKTVFSGLAGVYEVRNGMVIESTTFAAQISFTVDFLGVPVKVQKYHMVDLTN